jgi:hypothetical protein
MTEAEIQKILYKEFCSKKSHRLVVPNCKALGTPGEADLISVTKAGFVHEFEIKLSIRDFQRDFEDKSFKHKILENGGLRKPSRDPSANYFWFVAPEGVLTSVPDYAGLLEVSSLGIEKQKKAPRIHSVGISDRALRYLERGITIRYWENALRD